MEINGEDRGGKREAAGPIARLIEVSARNKFMVFLAVLFLTIGGIWAIKNTPLDAIPDLSDVQVIVLTEWPGRSPDLVEDQITYPIVSRMIAAPEVVDVRGYSFFGISFVYVIFEDGTDIYWARSRVLEYMSGLRGNLPEGVNPVLGPDATGVGWVFEYALVDRTGRHDLAEMRSYNDWYLKYALESVPGVAEVASVGGFVRQYQVNLDPNRLLAYNLPLHHVTDAIRRSNNDVGGRVIEISGREYMVRGRGYVRSTRDLEEIPVGVHMGVPILVRDVATVTLGPDIRRGAAELNGEGEVVGGIVVMRYGENALNVIRRIEEKIEEIRPSLPEGVEIVTTYDRSELIERSIDTLKHTLIEEAIVVSIVVLIFLFHARSAFVIILTLPVAVVIAFIPMVGLGLTANIMSIGGIAIAIGAMVDASIVLVENAHKHLERWEAEGRPGNRNDVIIASAKEVGPAIFFALLVITVGFFPVFTLTGQSGRLFKPLAYTKTFAMLFAALLAITLTPALMMIFIKGKVHSEESNPLSRVLIRMYEPVVRLVLALPKTLILLAVVALALTYVPYSRLGSEFMPPLNEGSILYMPTTTPGVSVSEAVRAMQLQDQAIRSVPEVASVFGKVGRARTSTDPAPLSMIETTIILKPEEEWRRFPVERFYTNWPESLEIMKKPLRWIWPEERIITWEEIVNDLDEVCDQPGWVNAWVFPIRTRIDMITTGIRTPIGIKIHGSDLSEIERIGTHIEAILSDLEGTRSVFAERVTGGTFIDFEVNRSEAARYGLRVEDVEMIIETAIGGMNIDQTVEGRERYPINVRYLRELRDNPDRLGRVLVPTPTGAQVPISQIADIQIVPGPPVIKDENGTLVGYVFVDIDLATTDLGGYVDRAKERIETELFGAGLVPPGYYLTWSGQYENMIGVRERLKIIIPVTILIIYLLLYMEFKSTARTLMVILSVPFALVGSFWFLWFLDYNLSIAVWVGIIALAGLAAETGVVMIIYLDEAVDRRRSEGRLVTMTDLKEAIVHGAAQRVRPKLMTVMTTMIGLVPILWSTGTGADMMKRLAAPMVGGLVTSLFLTLLIVPAVYLVYSRFTMSLDEDLEEVNDE